jgi:hypothetical protein
VKTAAVVPVLVLMSAAAGPAAEVSCPTGAPPSPTVKELVVDLREVKQRQAGFEQGSRCWYRVTLRRFTSPRGVWTPVRIEYAAGEAGR